MRFTKHTLITFAVVCAALFAFSAICLAADDDPVTVSGILSAAGCPLTDAQQKTIDGINADEGMMGLMMGMGELFTEDQAEALQAKLGERQMPQGMGGPPGGGQGGPGGGMVMMRIRNLMQVLILEKEGLPINEGQITKLNGIEMGPGMMEAMQEIYTAEQSEAMQKYYGGMGGPGGGMGGPPGGGGGMR